MKTSRPTPSTGEKLADVTPLRPDDEPKRTVKDTELSPTVPRAGQDSDAFPLAEEPAAQKQNDLDAIAELADAHDQIVTEIEKRIIGQRRVIEQLLVALFARGHAL